MVVGTNRAEPDILGVILPVRFGSASFFSLPGNAVSNMEMLVENRKHQCGRLPVTASVNGCCRPEQRHKRRYDIVKPSRVRLGFLRVENVTVVVFRQVIRWIENHEIGECRRKEAANLVKILVDDSTDDHFGASGGGETQQARRKFGDLGVAASERSVAWGSFLHHTPCGAKHSNYRSKPSHNTLKRCNPSP